MYSKSWAARSGNEAAPTELGLERRGKMGMWNELGERIGEPNGLMGE